jgi:hypothetical protein
VWVELSSLTSPGKIDRDRHCAAPLSLRARSSLAISDICKDLDEAFPVAAHRRRFMWRRMRHFVLARMRREICAPGAAAETDFSFCSYLRHSVFFNADTQYLVHYLH